MNTYTVTIDNYNPHTDTPDTVTVQGVAMSHDRDGLTIWAETSPTHKAAAIFRRWEHVTVERPACCHLHDVRH